MIKYIKYIQNCGLFLSFILLLNSCSEENKWKVDVESIDGTFKIYEFDQDFYENNIDLNTLYKKYRFFFTPSTPKEVYTKKRTDSIETLLYKDGKRFFSIEDLKAELTSIFKHIKYYYPDFKKPKVYTYISTLDYEYPVIYTGDKLLIAKDCFYGSNYANYAHIPKYIRHSFNQAYLGSKVVDAISSQLINPKQKDFKLVSSFVQEGKKLLIKDAFIPNAHDTIKTMYTGKKQYVCDANEFRLWNYFIEKDLLFKSNAKLKEQFLKVAPFSKFYTNIDEETPGEIGKWFGWQILKKYIAKNNVSLPKVLNDINNLNIFKKSSYKPNKL